MYAGYNQNFSFELKQHTGENANRFGAVEINWKDYDYLDKNFVVWCSNTGEDGKYYSVG